jgi:phosphatidylglycerophosphatase A
MNTSPEPSLIRAKSRQRIPAHRIFRDPYCFLAFGFGSGLAPFAPGTFGTLAAVPIYALVAGLSVPVYLAVVIVLFLAGIRICQYCEDSLGVQDHSGIVWDEIVGYLITLTAVPFSWKAAAVGFVLFRAFDVLKPWPISRLDRTVHGGLGVMLDDALAGCFAAACLYLLRPYAGF